MFMCAIHLRLDDGTGGAEGVIGEFIGCNMMMIEGLGHFWGLAPGYFLLFLFTHSTRYAVLASGKYGWSLSGIPGI